MKLSGHFRLFLLFSLFMWTEAVYSQFYILGRGLDDNEQPYAYATAELRGPDYFSQQICTEQGVFRFENLKAGSYELVLITSYGIRRKKIELRGSIDVTLHVPRNIQIDEISVVASKAGANEPVTQSNLTSTDIQQKDYGQDMPYILESTPSLVTTSDAGHGIGYTGLRIRGTDPTRINVTLNGIPVNDAESHNVFWVDLPDVASSSTNIQVHRGIGWSQPGTGDLGGGIHINTLGFHYEPYGALKLGLGSFDTKRITLQGGTGLMNGRFTVDARGSYISSNGYIDRAESTLYSYYLSAGYHHDQTNIRLLTMSGDELTYQAWNGVPEQYIDDPELRTYNTAGTEKPGEPYNNEVDDYRQNHYQLHYDQAITPFARWTTALHLTTGNGFFEQYKADQDLMQYGLGDTISDLVRQLWLDNDFYGFTSTLHIGAPESRYFVLGGGWSAYAGNHFGKVIWIENQIPSNNLPPYYENDALKKDYNIFARSNAKISDAFDVTFDLQQRWIRYSFEGPDENGIATDQNVNHNFFNPRIGFRYSFSEQSSLYGITGIIHKEPNRDDYINSTPLSRPTHEELWDTELGYRIRKETFELDLVGFAMIYKDQLVPTGRLNDVGAYTRVNVDQSHRLGVEVAAQWNPVKKLALGTQLTFSQNKIESFEEYIDDWDNGGQTVVNHTGTDIAFSPGVLAGLQAGYEIFANDHHELRFQLAGRYVGKQYVDNTSNEASQLDPYFVMDAEIHWIWYNPVLKEVHFRLSAKNLMEEKYESNGWIYRFNSSGYDPTPDDPYAGKEDGNLYHLKGYFPQAGRFLLFQAEIRF